MRLFTKEFFAARKEHGVSSDRPVFVVGLPRSGTTLVEQILASHPDVVGLGEIGYIERGLLSAIGKPFGSAAFFTALSTVRKSVTREAANAYLDRVSRRAGNARHMIDKMPHNFLVLGWIALLFPNTAVIHCVRDALDVCTSCYTHTFSEAHAYSNDLRVLGEYYRSYERLMQHWAKVLPVRILEARYENIIANQETASRSLIAELGLHWSDACLSFHRSERIVQTPSHWQVHQPIYGTSVGRWRRFEKHLGQLIDSLEAGTAAAEQSSGAGP
jgi:hypothetical protein